MFHFSPEVKLTQIYKGFWGKIDDTSLTIENVEESYIHVILLAASFKHFHSVQGFCGNLWVEVSVGYSLQFATDFLFNKFSECLRFVITCKGGFVCRVTFSIFCGTVMMNGAITIYMSLYTLRVLDESWNIVYIIYMGIGLFFEGVSSYISGYMVRFCCFYTLNWYFMHVFSLFYD